MKCLFILSAVLFLVSFCVPNHAFEGEDSQRSSTKIRIRRNWDSSTVEDFDNESPHPTENRSPFRRIYEQHKSTQFLNRETRSTNDVIKQDLQSRESSLLSPLHEITHHIQNKFDDRDMKLQMYKPVVKEVTNLSSKHEKRIEHERATSPIDTDDRLARDSYYDDKYYSRESHTQYENIPPHQYHQYQPYNSYGHDGPAAQPPPPPSPPPNSREWRPPPPPNDGWHPPPPPPHYDWYPPPPPPEGHEHPPPPPLSHDYGHTPSSSHGHFDEYNRPPPPRPECRSRYYEEDRPIRQSSFYHSPPHGGQSNRIPPPPPNNYGYHHPPPPQYSRYEPPPPHYRGPPPYHGGPPPRHDGPYGWPPGGPPPQGRPSQRGPPQESPPPREGPPLHEGPVIQGNEDRFPTKTKTGRPYQSRDVSVESINEDFKMPANDHEKIIRDRTNYESHTQNKDTQTLFDVRFLDDEPMENVRNSKETETSTTTVHPFPPFLYQAAAVTPET